MIRRLNFTGRRRIPRAAVMVRLVPGVNEGWAFDIDFSLAQFRFPPDASVFVEAYNATSYMRFDFGTVKDMAVPEDTNLTDITASPLPKFRLKVVDRRQRHGLLLGVADSLIPLRPDEELAHKQSLLPVEFVDLGDRVWRLDISDWPVLQLNRRIVDLGEIARSSEWFAGLVYPEVVRAVLEAAVIELDQTDPDLDDSHWTCLWLRYIGALHGMEKPPDGDTEDVRQRKQEWIEEAVQAFCRTRDTRDRFERAVGRSNA